MSDISVMIVSWNARRYLQGCLTSLQQTRGSRVLEIIVVDNASTDGSPEMVEAEFPEVILIRSRENLGFARANNLGLQRARGSLLAYVNSDVVVHPNCLQALAAFLDQNPRAGLTGPRVLGGDGRLQRTCRRLPTVWNTTCRILALDRLAGRSALFSGFEMRHWDHDTRREVEVLSGCFWLARRKAVDQVGGLDERFFFYAEDIDWCKRFRDAGWQIIFVPEAAATHFGGGSSANAPLRYSIEILRANLAYWKKHHGWLGRFAYFTLSTSHHCGRLVARVVMGMFSSARRADTRHKLQEDIVCLRWLLTGKGV